MPCGFFFFYLSIFFVFPRLISAVADWMFTIRHTWCGPSAKLECRSLMCCTWLAGNAGPKKSPKICHLGTIAQFCQATSSQLRNVSTIRRNLLNSNVSPTGPHNKVNFGPLAAEICWRVWSTPAHFNGFCSVNAQHFSSERQPNFAELNRGRHLYSAGRPSRWSLAYILVNSD